MYYSPDKILTYNRPVNVVVGDRGVGKTFALTDPCMSSGIATGDEAFAWVRRYKEDLKPLKGTWWKDVQDVTGKYQGIEFKSEGSLISAKRKDGKAFPIGSLVALTEYQRWKSVPHPKLKYIVFDEFMAEDTSKYLPNELEKWLNLVDSLMRMKKDVKVFMLSNSVSMANPYFEWLHLNGNDLGTGGFIKGSFWVVENTSYAEYRKAHSESSFGAMVAGTSYGSYSVDNKFLLDDLSDVTEKPPVGNMEHLWNFRIDGLLISVQETDANVVWISQAKDETFTCYTYYPQDAKDYGATLLAKTAWPIRYTVDSYLNEKMSFSNLTVKNKIVKLVREVYKNF